MAVLLLGVATAWAAAAAVQLVRSYVDGRAGSAEIGRARKMLVSPDPWDDGVEHRIEAARRSFGRARRAAGGRLVAPIRTLPIVGRQVRSFVDLAGTAEQVAVVSRVAVEDARGVLGARPPAGAGRVAALRELAELSSRTEASLGTLDLRHSTDLVRPLARRWATFEQQLERLRADLRRSSVTTAGVAEILAGPRRYLLLAANNAEMRAGSGMFLSAGTLSTDSGALSLGPMRPTGELVLGDGVVLDQEVSALWGWLQPGRDWRNLATSPRFDAVAPSAAQMWERLTGERVDGVLVLDVEFVRALLAVTGPVTVNGLVLSDATVVEHLLHGQYLALDFTEAAQASRREELGEIAAAALAALESRPYEIRRLVGELARVGGGRHVLAWAADREEQHGWTAAGITGALTGDSLTVSLLNRGGNKLDRHLGIESRLSVQPRDREADITVQVRIRNDTPEGGPTYVTGPHPDAGTREGDYLGILSLNLPGSATSISVDGDPPLVASGTDGPTKVVALHVLLARGEERWATVRFRLPSTRQSLMVTPSARVPGITWRAGTTAWSDDTPRSVTWRLPA